MLPFNLKVAAWSIGLKQATDPCPTGGSIPVHLTNRNRDNLEQINDPERSTPVGRTKLSELILPVIRPPLTVPMHTSVDFIWNYNKPYPAISSFSHKCLYIVKV